MSLLGAAACTGKSKDDGTAHTSAISTPPATCGPATSNEDVTFKPGAYRYGFNAVNATLTFTGDHTATLAVKNGSGVQIGAPSVYAISGTGARYDSQVADPAAIDDGASSSFPVTFPSQISPKTAGLLVLKFGDSNYGAFAPVPEGGSACP